MKLFTLTLMMIMGYAQAQISLTQVNEFGENPGDLKMYTYVPSSDIKGIVVLMHGCAQAASDFDDETGWTKMAEEKGLLLLLPQQTEINNTGRCFNWFEMNNISRGQGEVASVASMIDYVKAQYNSDRVFISGLSAGGAMSNIMMATYPEYFEAGAIVAGLPVGCATNLGNAWSCMSGFQFPIPTTQQRGDAVRNAAGPYNGTWPKVMIVHSTSDQFVNYKNAGYIFDQWVNVHGSEERVKLVTLKGIQHGFPVDPSNGCGEVGKFVLDAGYCAAEAVAEFFLSK